MNAKNLQLAYVGGGSKDWAMKLMYDLALEPELCGTVRLYDIDRPAAELNARLGNRISASEQSRGKWEYTVSASLEECLQGADVVIISILPGTFEEMRSDVHQPEKYGIFQPVGDTVGPGGMMRALRCVPMIAEIAEAISRICPRAWVINYTNPMCACTLTLYEVFPQIRAIGCCHEVFSVQRLLAKMVEELYGVKDIPRQDIHVNVVGINHFTLITKASWNGIDLFDVCEPFVSKYEKAGYSKHGELAWNTDPFAHANLVKFDLYRKYGFFGSAGDRHLSEFVPAQYLANCDTPAQWKFALTTVDYRIKQRAERTEKVRQLADGEIPLDIQHSGEEGVDILKALAGVTSLVANVNLPNAGQIPNIPDGIIVETNALIDTNGVFPVLSGALTDPILAITMPHAYGQRDIVHAALAKDRGEAFRIFLLDPMVRRLDYDAAYSLFCEMESNTLPYLPWGTAVV